MFSVEVSQERQGGKECSQKLRNQFGIKVEVFVPLEYCVFETPGSHYVKLRRVAKKWLAAGEEEDLPK